MSEPLVLIADDDRQALLAAEAYIREMNIETLTTDKSSEVIPLVTENFPSALLLDVLMPSPDGFDICREIKKSQNIASVPVVFMSSMEDIEKKACELEPDLQPDAILTKPLKKSLLQVTIRSMIRISDQYRKLDENLKNLRELEQLKDNLINMLAHDMRHPLQSIYGYCAFLDGSISSGIPLSDIAQNIKNHAYRLNHMIQNFLDVGRLESRKLPLFWEKLKAGECVAECAHRLHSLASAEDVELNLDCRNPETVFPGDSMVISRILDNLVNNAIKYSPKGSQVTLICLENESEDCVEFAVKDEGPGIPDEYKDCIFQKFGASKVNSGIKKPSVGLGLAFCKLAVETHQGEVRVEDNPEGGSIFRILLPASRRSSEISKSVKLNSDKE